jgi:TonB family protein
VGSAQQSDLTKGIQAYDSGKYSESINIFKTVTKTDGNNSDAWHYLGLAYIRIGKSKDSFKPLERAVKLKPADADFQASLAYAYMLSWDRRADERAKQALKIDAKNSLANFVRSVAALRKKSYDEASAWATKALETSPRLSAALLVRSKALVALFASEPYPPIKTPEVRRALLENATSDLETYLRLEINDQAKIGLEEYLESLKFFADYYSQPDTLNQPGQRDLDSDPTVKPMRIIQKPHPSYTSSARAAGVEGTSTLIVEFRADGTIGHVIVAYPLEDSLDRAVLVAARGIRFEPKMRNGVPVSSVRRIEYTFEIR